MVGGAIGGGGGRIVGQAGDRHTRPDRQQRDDEIGQPRCFMTAREYRARITGIGGSPSAMNTVLSVSDDAGDAATTSRRSRIAPSMRCARSATPLVFDQDLVADIRTEMRVALDHFAERLDDGQELFVTKHRIATVLDCEAHFLRRMSSNGLLPRRRGRSRTVQSNCSSWRGEPSPTELVDEAMARLADEDRGIGSVDCGARQGRRGRRPRASIERVTKFVESFPPLDRRANPVTEAAAQWPISGPILLQARVDLMIGKPAGTESRKVIIDLKTGRAEPRHRQDLGFYALSRHSSAVCRHASSPRSTSTPRRHRPRT